MTDRIILRRHCIVFYSLYSDVISVLPALILHDSAMKAIFGLFTLKNLPDLEPYLTEFLLTLDFAKMKKYFS